MDVYGKRKWYDSFSKENDGYGVYDIYSSLRENVIGPNNQPYKFKKSNSWIKK